MKFPKDASSLLQRMAGRSPSPNERPVTKTDTPDSAEASALGAGDGTEEVATGAEAVPAKNAVEGSDAGVATLGIDTAAEMEPAIEAELFDGKASTPPPLSEPPSHNSPPGRAATPSAALLSDARFLSDLCTRLWRFENRLHEAIEKRQDDAEMEHLGRRFEEVMETLRRNDYEIIDLTGQKYDPGLNLRVLQFEPREDLRHEMIIETVKPALRVKGVLLSGEVIVGVPHPHASEDTDNEPEIESPAEEST